MISKQTSRSYRTMTVQNGGRLSSMAGKQNIVLPSLAVPLSSACLKLLWSKNPSTSERKLRQICITHKSSENTFHTYLPLSYVRFVDRFQTQMAEVFRCTVTRNIITTSHVRTEKLSWVVKKHFLDKKNPRI